MPKVVPPDLQRSGPAEPFRKALEAELARAVEGEVRFDDGSRALYCAGGSNYRQVPIGVVIPKRVEDVIETMRICRSFGAPLLSRGGGTSLAGQCVNVAVVVDFSKYLNRVVSFDPERKLATVEPGLILDHLRSQAKEKFDLTFPPDPATHNHCTLGGMIGNNSCGVHSVMTGRTSDNVHELEVLTYDGLRLRVGQTSDTELESIIREGGRRGEIYGRLKALRDKYGDLIRQRFPRIPRRVSGYNLDELLPEKGFHVARALVGTEGTCVSVLEAVLHLTPWPKSQSLLVLGYPDVFSAADHVTEIMKFNPIGLEGLDDMLVKYSVEKGLHPDARSWLPEGNGWLLVEFGGDTKEESDAKAMRAMAVLKALPGAPDVKFYDDPEKEHAIWKIRESGLGATARVPSGPDTWEGWEDSAVPPEKLGDYLRDLKALFKKYEYEAALYGHFGQGCVHTRIPFDFYTQPGIRKYRNFMDEATSLVVSYGGSLSGEHGDGQSRAEFLPKMYGPELVEAFREFKSIWDPAWKMNPGKVVDPYPVDSNLRLGPGYRPREVQTHFQYPDDHGNLPYATLRCVGVGKCRRTEGGVMCPSFMATREEMHSTRGRAHLLHELLTEDILKDGWQNESVKQALDLCLACKGCKKECPVNVDMATYKAEFLSHYYEKKPRSRSAYAMGLIDQWARIGSKVPRLANWVMKAPGLSDAAKAFAGIARQRKVPEFARRTFKDVFFSRGERNAGLPPVLLWADTFTNYFEPGIADAAVEVLEAAGFRVLVPREHLCCGRPLYDYGMLDLAKSYLRNVLRELRPILEAGIPVVGLEPSCMAVFKDEMRNLFPIDRDAQRLRENCFMLGEFLMKKAKDLEIPKLEGKALVQGHCHHKAVLDFESDKKVLEKLGLDFEILDSGCCGMAGSFGFEEEAGRYEVSMKIGERDLLPRVRQADRSTLIIADGFSCRHQIIQGAGREPVHLSEVVRMALRRAGYQAAS